MKFTQFIFTVIVVLAYFAVNYFAQPQGPMYRTFFAEDHFMENLQVLVCLATTYFAFKAAYQGKIKWLRICFALGGIMMFIVAGEEISWGQRIFNITSDYFSTYNYQGETNLHNLMNLESDLRPYYAIAFFMGVILNGIGYKIAQITHQKWSFIDSFLSALLIGVLYYALPMQTNIYFYEYTEIWLYGSVLIYTLRLRKA